MQPHWLNNRKVGAAQRLHLFGDAERISGSWGLSPHDLEETRTIYDSFVALTPAIKACSLVNIVNAGWNMYLSGFADWEKYAEIKNDSRKAERLY